VGTKVRQLVAENPNRVCVFVQNLGSGNIYILSAQNQGTADGIKVVTTGTYKVDTTTAELFIVADADTQDVRVQVDGD